MTVNVSYPPKESVVWLVLDRHEEQEDPVEELESLEGRDAHVQEHPEEHWHGDGSEHGSQKH